MLTSVGLAVLTWLVLVLHALTYGAIAVVSPGMDVDAPVVDRYRLALAVGVVVNLTGSLGLTWWGARTWARAWPPAALGAGAAVVAAVVAGCVLLLILGIDPIDVVRSFVTGP